MRERVKGEKEIREGGHRFFETFLGPSRRQNAAGVRKGNYIETYTRRSTSATSRGEIDRIERRRESERKNERERVNVAKV